jgi:hypothetical protein
MTIMILWRHESNREHPPCAPTSVSRVCNSDPGQQWVCAFQPSAICTGGDRRRPVVNCAFTQRRAPPLSNAPRNTRSFQKISSDDLTVRNLTKTGKSPRQFPSGAILATKEITSSWIDTVTRVSNANLPPGGFGRVQSAEGARKPSSLGAQPQN